MRRWIVCVLVVAARASADPAQDRDACLRAAGAAAAPAHTDPFAANVFADAVMALHGCQGDWQKVCLPRVLQALPPDLDGLASKVDEIGKRYFAVDGPAKCPVQGEANPSTVNEIAFWCRNRREDCENPHLGPLAGQPVLDTANREAACVAQLDWSDQQAKQRTKCEQDYQAEVQQQQDAERQREQQQSQAREQQPQTDKTHQQKQADDQSRAAQVKARQDPAEREEKAREQADAANATYAANLAGAVNAVGGGGHESANTARLFSVGFGAGFLSIPVFVTNSTTSKISESGAMGIGGTLELEDWPWYRPHFGYGWFFEGDIGALALVGGQNLLASGLLGLRGFVGKDSSIALLGELSAGARWATTGQGDLTNYTQGSGGYWLGRAGLGMRLCFAKQDDNPGLCDKGIDLELLVDDPSIGKSMPMVTDLRFFMRTLQSIDIQVGWDYAAAGTPNAAMDSGTFVAVLYRRTYDSFKEPEGGQRVSVDESECDDGNANACNDLSYTDVPQAQANRALERGCALGSAESCRTLAQSYQSGSHGLAQNLSKVPEYLDRACTLGSGDSCYELGHAYESGQFGLTPDPARGKALVDRACSLHNGDWNACASD